MTNLQTPNCQTGVAGADLSSHAGKFVAFDAAKRLVPCTSATSATALGGPIGVCYSNVGSLRAVAYAIGGNTDVFAANTLAPGDFITANSVSLATPAGSGGVAIAQAHQWAVPGQLARVEMCTPFRVSGPV
jgi:hypothetical protein